MSAGISLSLSFKSLLYFMAYFFDSRPTKTLLTTFSRFATVELQPSLALLFVLLVFVHDTSEDGAVALHSCDSILVSSRSLHS